MPKETKKRPAVKKVKKACGLCGNNTKELTKTECCKNWICDDEEEYDMSSSPYRNSCSRNHRKYSLCAFHYGEDHEGKKWQECQTCKESFSRLDYKLFASEKYNFEKLDIPKITCVVCGFRSKAKEGFAYQYNGDYYCVDGECQKQCTLSLCKSVKGKTEVKKVSKDEVNKASKAEVKKVSKAEVNKVKNACGLCGNTTKELTKTECCKNWICDDEEEFDMSTSPNRSSCSRNHRKYSLCAFHYGEDHEGKKWQECQTCKESFSRLDYQLFASEKYNFEKLDIPKITCVVCGFRSKAKEGFAYQYNGDYYCVDGECQRQCMLSLCDKRKAEMEEVSKSDVKKAKKA